jgi:hypothetical protein
MRSGSRHFGEIDCGRVFDADSFASSIEGSPGSSRSDADPLHDLDAASGKKRFLSAFEYAGVEGVGELGFVHGSLAGSRCITAGQ